MKVLLKSQIKNAKDREQIEIERAILEAADHPYVVSLRYAFQSNTKLYMVMLFIISR